jgi:hypothetical protein
VTIVDSDAVEKALVRDYLGRLHAAGWGLAPARRDELVAEVAEHINEALRAEGDAGAHGEAVVRNVLERLGPPEDIARAALEHGDEPVYAAIRAEDGTTLRDVWTLLLLTFGGFFIGFGWLVGVVLLWSTPRWSTRDRWLATLVWPFGVAGLWFAMGHRPLINEIGWVLNVGFAAAVLVEVVVTVHMLRSTRRLPVPTVRG